MQIKLFPNLAKAIAEILLSVFSEGRKADKVIASYFKQNKQWGSRDRAVVAELSYEIIRHWRWLWFLNDKNEPQLSHNNLYQLIGTYLHWRGEAIPEFLDYKPVKQVRREEVPFQIAESWSDELHEFMLQELGDKWLSEAFALNEQAKIVIRVNTLKIDIPTLVHLLEKEEGIKSYPLEGYPDALLLPQKSNVFRSRFFHEGFFEVQDANSQRIAEFCEVKPGMTVIDACAGAGGKTLHLATLMQNKGRIIAMDVHDHKLQELRKRLNRAGIQNTETRLYEPKQIKRLNARADRLLLDVPCSGTGTFKRNPDAKWRVTQEYIFQQCELQRHILQHYAKLTSPGGLLIYSTCSILPCENEHQITWFQEHFPNFKLLEQKTLYPSQTGFDGFYMAKLIREY